MASRDIKYLLLAVLKLSGAIMVVERNFLDSVLSWHLNPLCEAELVSNSIEYLYVTILKWHCMLDKIWLRKQPWTNINQNLISI